MTYTTSSHEPAVPVAAFPAGCEVHWETQNRSVWNEQECANEQQELIYEVAWIPELNLWRRFLRSRRKVQGSNVHTPEEPAHDLAYKPGANPES